MIQLWIRVSGDVPARVAAVRSALAALTVEGYGGEPTPGALWPPRLLQIVGGESTGKSTLAAALGEALPAVVVPEALRGWVVEHGRVPDAGEQWDVMRAQARAEDEALAALAGAEARTEAGTHELPPTAPRASSGRPRWVVSDGGVLMTAVYSIVYYNDPSLLPAAAQLSDRYALTIWCDDDVPWQADPQRDGPDLRAAAQRIIGEALS